MMTMKGSMSRGQRELDDKGVVFLRHGVMI